MRPSGHHRMTASLAGIKTSTKTARITNGLMMRAIAVEFMLSPQEPIFTGSPL